MAQGDVVVNVVVESANAAKNIGDIKQSIKDMQKLLANKDVGSEQFKKLTAAIADAKGKIGDLNTSIKQNSGSGIEKLKTSFSLFSEGVNNFDPSKIKASLGGIGAAFKAIPVLLIVQGISYLIEKFDDLKESGGIIGKVFSAIGDAISWCSDKLEEFGDFISNVDTDAKKLAETQIKAAEDTKKAIGERYDFEIAKAAAAGKETEGIEREKAQAAIKSIDEQIQAIVKLGNIKGELNKKEKEQLAELGKERVKVLESEEIANIKFVKNIDDAIKKQQDKEKEAADKKKEANKKASQELAERHEKERQDLIKAQEAAFKAAKDEEAWQDASLEYLKKTDALKLAQQEEYNKQELDAKGSVFNDTVALGAKAYEEDKKNFEASEAAKNEALNKSLDAAKGLSEAFFAFQLNGAKGNAAKELQIRKQMFAVDKAFNVARAVQDGIRSVQAALTIPPPGGQILAGVNAALAAANVAKILATKFDGGGAASAVSDLGSAGSNVSTAAPVVNTIAPTTQTPTTTTLLGENGENMGQRVYVLESDITKSQARIAKLNEQATV